MYSVPNVANASNSQSTARRVIGPVPPRDKHGRMLLAPLLEKRVKLNLLGEPVRGPDGQPIEEMVDARHPWEYRAYQRGDELHIAEGATKGLKLYRVDVGIEPIMLVYAKNEQDAVEVWKKEWGVTRISNEPDSDPKVTLAEQAA
ncbi:MAG TPA: hypothetical protein VE999_23240 [Gemmataceae bacterium]|nr:hypothetical protein [Gemmataceae bacterium]